MVFDDTMEDEMRITVIATGISKTMDKKIINLRDLSPEERDENWTVRLKEDLDKPTFQRQLSAEDDDRFLREKALNSGRKGILKRVFQKDNLEYPTFLRKQAD